MIRKWGSVVGAWHVAIYDIQTVIQKRCVRNDQAENTEFLVRCIYPPLPITNLEGERGAAARRQPPVQRRPAAPGRFTFEVHQSPLVSRLCRVCTSHSSFLEREIIFWTGPRPLGSTCISKHYGQNCCGAKPFEARRPLSPACTTQRYETHTLACRGAAMSAPASQRERAMGLTAAAPGFR